jgi:glycosyltransferase involved in cell wall biosynthesis
MKLARPHRPKKIIGVVVPAFDDRGGVAAVADFILRAIARRPEFEARIVSLAMSASDPTSLLLHRPWTWRRGVVTHARRENGYDFVHVGARFGELEFQRVAPRPQLNDLLEGCDLIQVVCGAPSWAHAVMGLNVPVVLQTATLTAVERRMRASIESGPMALWRSIMTRIAARLDESALRGVDAVLVENPWMRDYCEAAVEGLPARVVYAPPGVNTNVFQPLASTEARPARPFLLAVGRFADLRKNPMLLLEAYHQLTQLRDDAPELILAGAAPPDQRFWDRARALGLEHRIRLVLGPGLEELALLFRQALCLVLASDEEGFGVVVIEAMSSGVPVVATRCGGPEGIITDGVDGFLVDRNDATSMAERVGRFVASPALAQEMGRRARSTVEGRFSDTVAGDVYLNLYDELLAAT